MSCSIRHLCRTAFFGVKCKGALKPVDIYALPHNYTPMHPIEHIRKRVLGLNQAAFAVIAGVTQATVSRWESGELEPGREELGRIRDEARARGIAWDDRWFFEPPNASAAPEPGHAA
jgi:hypothetical protein